MVEIQVDEWKDSLLRGQKPIKLWQRDYRFLESVLSVTVSEIKKNKQKKRSGS